MEISSADLNTSFGKHKDLLKKLMVTAPTETDRVQVKQRIEDATLRLIRIHFITSKRKELLDEVLGPLENKIKNSKDNTDDGAAIKMLDEMQKVADDAEDDYLKTLTDAAIRESEEFRRFKEEMNEMCEEIGFGDRKKKKEKETDATKKKKKVGEEGPSSSTKSQNKKGRNSKANDSVLEDDDENEDDEDDEFIPAVDPLSKQPLKDPVKNRYCGHVYGKASMVKMISKNKKLKCPYSGCTNPQFIREEHLIQDDELKARVAAKVAKNNAGSSSTQSRRTPARRNRLDDNDED